MADRVETIIFPVRDLDKAKAVFGKWLGVQPAQDEPYYVGYELDGQTIGLDPNGHRRGMTGPVVYTVVDDIETRLRELAEAGAEVKQEVQHVGGGRRIAWVQDADGNSIGLVQDAE